MDAPVALPLTSTDAAAVPAVDLGLRFDNSFARLPATFYTRLAPTPLPDPYLVAFSESAAQLIGLDPARLRSGAAVEALTGNRPLTGAEPLAAVYSGHQFGVYVPRLGRRPGDPARRGGRCRRPALGSAAQGRRQDAVLADGRRPRGAALVDPRVPVLRGAASPRHSVHPRAGGGRLRHPGDPRDRRDRGRRHPHVAELRALRVLRVLLLDRAARRAAATGRLRDRPLLPGEPGRAPALPALPRAGRAAGRRACSRNGRASASATAC